MNNPESGLIRGLPEHIRLAYKESLLNVSSYRPRFKEGRGSLTLHDAKWATIAVGSALTFGVAAAQFLGRIP